MPLVIPLNNFLKFEKIPEIDKGTTLFKFHIRVEDTFKWAAS